MSNSVTPREARPQTVRAAAARQAIAERFVAASQKPPVEPYNDPLALPAIMSLKGLRVQHDGSLQILLSIPREFVADVFLPLTTLAEQPLAVTLEPIDLPEYDA